MIILAGNPTLISPADLITSEGTLEAIQRASAISILHTSTQFLTP